MPLYRGWYGGANPFTFGMKQSNICFKGPSLRCHDKDGHVSGDRAINEGNAGDGRKNSLVNQPIHRRSDGITLSRYQMILVLHPQVSREHW